ncbi:hypothetical protein EV361DRAFT_923348 [Lentinula raphanica]|uniref:DUF4384 domain-containing protein n=1 Tax=Lentinula raphanica TaxID=153919 RepID=A0AA38PK15_9AGAR|nr:hypothetical protein F5878DRAFT_637390 [Lentinula raphanica]KAJ3968940.1 hypothetical protein EV361DRAFT_923348 [Lentinula raphanica]
MTMSSVVMKLFAAYFVLMCCLGAIASPVLADKKIPLQSRSPSGNIIGTAYFTAGYKPKNWKLVFKTHSESFFYVQDSAGKVEYSKEGIHERLHPFEDASGQPIVLVLDPQEDPSLLVVPPAPGKTGVNKFLDETEGEGTNYGGPEWVKAAMERLILRQFGMQHKKPSATWFDVPSTVRTIQGAVDVVVSKLVKAEEDRRKTIAQLPNHSGGDSSGARGIK